MKKIIFVCALFALLPFGTPAQATPVTLRLEAGPDADHLSLIGEFRDGFPGDISPLVNVLVVQGAFTGFTLSTTTGNGQNLQGDIAKLTLNSVSIVGTGAGTLRMTVINENLTSPYSGAAVASAVVGGLLINSAINVQSWVKTTSGGSLAVYDPPVSKTGGAYPGANFSFMDTESLYIAPGDLITMTTQATIDFSPGGSAKLTIASLKLNPAPAPVPEPGSLPLLLISSTVLGLGTIARRRNKRRTEARS